jgi:hypothetical protein
MVRISRAQSNVIEPTGNTATSSKQFDRTSDTANGSTFQRSDRSFDGTA